MHLLRIMSCIYPIPHVHSADFVCHEKVVALLCVPHALCAYW